MRKLYFCYPISVLSNIAWLTYLENYKKEREIELSNIKIKNEKFAEKINLDSYLLRFSKMIIPEILGITFLQVFLILSIEYFLK